jgi:hypothetical protein
MASGLNPTALLGSSLPPGGGGEVTQTGTGVKAVAGAPRGEVTQTGTDMKAAAGHQYPFFVYVGDISC